MRRRFAARAAPTCASCARLDPAWPVHVAAVPRAQRKLVTDHDAFGYFAARYGIDVVGAAIPRAPPGTALGRRARDAGGDDRREDVRAVFPERSVNSKVAETLARETGATARYELYGDTLGPKGSSGETYLKMEAANADAMVRGFTGGSSGCRTDAIVAKDTRALAAAGPDRRLRRARRRSSRSAFAIERGMRVGVLGPNGGGKTTLFRVLLGEVEPSRDRVWLGGRPGTVPQTERSRLDYPVSALDVALMGTLARLPWWRRPGRARARVRALEALADVGLADLAGETFGELSGGQRQRVLVARALVQDADLLLLDEPFSGLDEPSAAQLTKLIDDLARDGRAVMVATHDMEQTRAWDRVLCLNRRQVAFGPPARSPHPRGARAHYGGSIVMLPGEGDRRGVFRPPHPPHNRRDRHRRRLVDTCSSHGAAASSAGR